jgi:hypothetical protein
MYVGLLLICTMGFGEDKGVHLHVCGPSLFLLHSCRPIHNPCVGKEHLGLKIVTCKVEILCVLRGFRNSLVIGRNVTKGSKGFAYVSLVFVVPRYLGPHNFLSHCNSPPFKFFWHTYICFNRKPHLDVFLGNHMSGTFHMELIHLIFNIWFSISWSLIIIWMVFGLYFHFVVLCDEYHIFTNIFWNHLISIKNVIYFENFPI